MPAKYKYQAKLAVKDEYNFEFLEITDKHALKEINQPIGVASYKITPAVPKNMKKYLPSPETIIESLSGIIEQMRQFNN